MVNAGVFGTSDVGSIPTAPELGIVFLLFVWLK